MLCNANIHCFPPAMLLTKFVCLHSLLFSEECSVIGHSTFNEYADVATCCCSSLVDRRLKSQLNRPIRVQKGRVKYYGNQPAQSVCTIICLCTITKNNKETYFLSPNIYVYTRGHPYRLSQY